MVDGRVFYWDYRQEGGKPGEGIEPGLGRKGIVRVVSEDKRWRLTVDLGRGGTGGKVLVEPGGRKFPFLPIKANVPPRSGFTMQLFTPRVVRILIKRYHTPA